MCRYSDSLEEKLLLVTQRLGCGCFLVNHSTIGPKSSSEDQKVCGLEDPSRSGAALWVERLTSCCPSVPSADLIHFWALTTNDLVGSESLTVIVLPKRWTLWGTCGLHWGYHVI